jgi:hypothetical protein
MSKIFLVVGILNLNQPGDVAFVYDQMPNIIVCQQNAKVVKENYAGLDGDFAIVTKCIDFEEKSS